MRVLAGSTKGVFAIVNGTATLLLESPDVRDLFRSSGHLFAGTRTGLYRSADDGASWSLVGMGDREVWTTRDAPDGTLYAGTQPAGLFRSSDAGESWHEVETFAAAPEAAIWCVPIEPPQPGRARALVIDREDGRRIWVGVEVGGIMRTDDRGESWTFSLPGENPDLHMMYADPVKPGVLYASTGYGRPDGIAEMVEGNAGVYRSDDYGASWQYAFHGITPQYSRPMCVDRRAPYGLTVASAPSAFSSFKDDGGAQAMLFRSDNGGISWRSLCDPAHSPARENIHGLTPDPEVPGGVVIGTDTGDVWRVDDDAGWTRLSSGMPPVLSVVAY